jgi:hypothetical protein
MIRNKVRKIAKSILAAKSRFGMEAIVISYLLNETVYQTYKQRPRALRRLDILCSFSLASPESFLFNTANVLLFSHIP